MTVREMLKAWERVAVRAIRSGLPAPAGLEQVKVIFPDGSPVRTIEYGFVDGEVCMIVSGERE